MNDLECLQRMQAILNKTPPVVTNWVLTVLGARARSREGEALRTEEWKSKCGRIDYRRELVSRKPLDERPTLDFKRLYETVPKQGLLYQDIGQTARRS